MNNLKQHFPIFADNNLIYLDNAATTQKPQQVISAMSDFYSKSNANVHRGLYPLSETSTTLYESARQIIAAFIGAQPSEVIFTSGTTDGINSLAHSLSLSKIISSESTVLVSELEHHSNILPWQRFAKVAFVGSRDFGIDNEDLLIKVTELKPAVVALSTVSNVTGAVWDVAGLTNQIKAISPQTLVVVDAAQSLAHMPTNVADWNIDALAASGHKIYGPMGIGILYVKTNLLQRLEPFRVGGGMVGTVAKDSADWTAGVEKFEAGTPNVAGAIALATAVKFLLETEWQEISAHNDRLRKYALLKLNEIADLRIFHPKHSNAIGVISFQHSKVHPHDISALLGDPEFGTTKKQVAVRAGHHCTQILHKHVLQSPASLRISIGIYNSQEDIETFIIKLKEILDFLS